MIESFGIDGEPSTKAAATAIAAITDRRRVLVVLDREDALGWKSLRNLPAVHLIEQGQLNTYDVLVNDDVVFTAEALETFLAGPVKRSPNRVDKAGDTSARSGEAEGAESKEDQ